MIFNALFPSADPWKSSRSTAKLLEMHLCATYSPRCRFPCKHVSKRRQTTMSRCGKCKNTFSKTTLSAKTPRVIVLWGLQTRQVLISRVFLTRRARIWNYFWHISFVLGATGTVNPPKIKNRFFDDNSRLRWVMMFLRPDSESTQNSASYRVFGMIFTFFHRKLEMKSCSEPKSNFGCSFNKWTATNQINIIIEKSRLESTICENLGLFFILILSASQPFTPRTQKVPGHPNIQFIWCVLPVLPAPGPLREIWVATLQCLTIHHSHEKVLHMSQLSQLFMRENSASFMRRYGTFSFLHSIWAK